MISDDSSDFRKRAEAEGEPARRSARPKAGQAHYDLGAPYLELLWGSMDHASRARPE